MTERLKALRNAKDPIQFWGNAKPLCPHCGEPCSIDHNEWWHLYDDNDSHKVDCPYCALPFIVRTRVLYSFSTDEQED